MEDQRVHRTDHFRSFSHPLYRTSNQTYGSKTPAEHERQTQFKGNSRQFSEAMLQSGMFRDCGFNTSVERSRVMVSTATQNNRVSLHHYYCHGNHSNDGNNK